MNVIDKTATGIGYTVFFLCCAMILAVVIFWLADLYDNRKQKKQERFDSIKTTLACHTDEFGEVNERISKLESALQTMQEESYYIKAEVNDISNYVDQFRPAPGFEKPEPKEGDIS